MIEHHYNYFLVAISIAVAIVASYTALALSQRMIYARLLGRGHFAWLAASAGTMGVGIWSMHFVAMLAYMIDTEVRYRIDLTALSVVFAILGTGIAFAIVNRRRTTPWLFASGTFMGLAICSMHYTGMAAYHAGVAFHYSWPTVGLSMAIAIGASITALWTIFSSEVSRWVQAGASVILGAAISGMHYTGMAALTMVPDPHVHVPADAGVDPLLWTFNNNYLAVITVGVSATIALVASLVTTHSAKIYEFVRRENQTLRHANRMEAIGQLTGGIAHDFRNILAVMQSGVALLERGKSVAEVAPLLQQTVERGHFLVEKLLSFARERPVDARTVRLSEFLTDNNLLLTKALPAHIQLNVEVHEDSTVSVDPDACSLALINLVINARDAMPKGGTIEIRANRVNGRAHLCVKDTGTGMSDEVIARVFEPFYTTKPEGKGSGLGLPQVQGFVQGAGGEIKIVSHLGWGTEVHIFLPLNGESK